uniref:probable G-protein coupled receptor 139 n=1 Tax=Pristiophorus japonicus TaxID=55135 RepID=UPI00398EEF19
MIREVQLKKNGKRESGDHEQKTTRQMVQEALKVISLAKRYSVLITGGDNGSSAECCLCQFHATKGSSAIWLDPRIVPSSDIKLQYTDDACIRSHFKAECKPSSTSLSRHMKALNFHKTKYFHQPALAKQHQKHSVAMDKMEDFRCLGDAPSDQNQRFGVSSQKMGYPIIYWIECLYYPVLAVFGVSVNLVAIMILSRGKCGLSKCITRYLVGMSAADLFLVVTDVILNRINIMYFPVSFLFITPVCSVLLVVCIASLDCSVWFTVAFTFDRFVTICCQKLRAKYCTQRTATVVLGAFCVVSCVRCIPFYFTFQPHVTIDQVHWFCVPNASYMTSPFWRAYEWIDSMLTPLIPICLIVFFNALTVRHILAANRIRRGLRSNGENQNDREMQNRKKSMVLLFTLSGNFILLWMVYVVHSLSWTVENFNYNDKYLNTPVYNVQQVGFMLQILCSFTNTCIYGLTQAKFRAELKSGMKYLFTLIGKLIK